MLNLIDPCDWRSHKNICFEVRNALFFLFFFLWSFVELLYYNIIHEIDGKITENMCKYCINNSKSPSNFCLYFMESLIRCSMYIIFPTLTTAYTVSPSREQEWSVVCILVAFMVYDYRTDPSCRNTVRVLPRIFKLKRIYSARNTTRGLESAWVYLHILRGISPAQISRMSLFFPKYSLHMRSRK